VKHHIINGIYATKTGQEPEEASAGFDILTTLWRLLACKDFVGTLT